MAVEDYLLRFRLDIEPALRVIDRLNTATTSLHSTFNKTGITPKVKFDKSRIKEAFDDAVRGVKFAVPAEVVVNFSPQVDTAKLEKQIVEKLRGMKASSRGKTSLAEKVLIQVSLADGASKVKRDIQALIKDENIKITPYLDGAKKDIIDTFVKTHTGTKELNIEVKDARGSLASITRQINDIPRSIPIELVPITSDTSEILGNIKKQYGKLEIKPKVENSASLTRLKEFIDKRHPLRIALDERELEGGKKGSFYNTIRVTAEKALRTAFGQMQRDKKGIDIPVSVLDVKKATVKELEATQTAINKLSKQISDAIKIKISDITVNTVNVRKTVASTRSNDGGDEPPAAPAAPARGAGRPPKSTPPPPSIPQPARAPKATRAAGSTSSDDSQAMDVKKIKLLEAAKKKLETYYNDLLEVVDANFTPPSLSLSDIASEHSIQTDLTGVGASKYYSSVLDPTKLPAAQHRARSVEAARKELSSGYKRLTIGSGKKQQYFAEAVTGHYGGKIAQIGQKGISSGKLDEEAIEDTINEIQEFTQQLHTASVAFANSSSDAGKKRIVSEISDPSKGALGRIGITSGSDIKKILTEYENVAKKHLSNFKMDSTGNVIKDPLVNLPNLIGSDPRKNNVIEAVMEQLGVGQPGIVDAGGILQRIISSELKHSIGDYQESAIEQLEKQFKSNIARTMGTNFSSRAAISGITSAGRNSGSITRNMGGFVGGTPSHGNSFRETATMKKIKELIGRSGGRIPNINEFNQSNMQDPMLGMFYNQLKSPINKGLVAGFAVPNKKIMGTLPGKKESELLDLGKFSNEIFLSPKVMRGKNRLTTETVANHELFHGLYSNFGQYMNGLSGAVPSERSKAFTNMPNTSKMFDITAGLRRRNTSPSGMAIPDADAKILSPLEAAGGLTSPAAAPKIVSLMDAITETLRGAKEREKGIHVPTKPGLILPAGFGSTPKIDLPYSRISGGYYEKSREESLPYSFDFDKTRRGFDVRPEQISRQGSYLESFSRQPLSTLSSFENNIAASVPNEIKKYITPERMDALFEGMHEAMVSVTGLASSAPDTMKQLIAGKVGLSSNMDGPFGTMDVSDLLGFSDPLLKGVKDPLSMSGQGQIMKNLEAEIKKLGTKDENQNFSKFFERFRLGDVFARNIDGDTHKKMSEELSSGGMSWNKLLAVMNQGQNQLLGGMAGGYGAKFDLADLESQRKWVRNRTARGKEADLYAPLEKRISSAEISPLIYMRDPERDGKRTMATFEALMSNQKYDEGIFDKDRKGQPISSINIKNLETIIVKYRDLASALKLVSEQSKGFIMEMAKTSPVIENAIKLVEKSTGKLRSELSEKDLQGSIGVLGLEASGKVGAVNAARRESYHDIRRRNVEILDKKLGKGVMPEQHELLQAFTGMTKTHARERMARGEIGRDSLAGYIMEHGVTPGQLAHIRDAKMDVRTDSDMKSVLGRAKESPEVAKTLEAVTKLTGITKDSMTAKQLREGLGKLLEEQNKKDSEYKDIEASIPRYDLSTAKGMHKAMGYLSEAGRKARVYETDPETGEKKFKGYDSDEMFFEQQLQEQRKKLEQKMKMAKLTGKPDSYRTQVKSREGTPLIDETAFISKGGDITGTVSESLKKGVLSIHGINGELNQAIHKVVNWTLATGAVFGMLRAFKGAQEVIVSFNKEMTNLQAILNPTSEQMDRLAESAVNIGTNYGQDIRGVVASMTEFARAGLKQKEIIEATEASMLLANVAMLDSKDASKAVMTVMKQMQIPFAEAVGVIDKLTSVDAAFAVSLEDLTQGLGRTGRAAVAFGMDIDHVIALIGTVGEATQRSGKEIGTAFRTAFARGVSGQTIKLFESLGIQVRDAQGNVANFQGIIDKIGLSWKKLSDVQKLAVAEGLGGKMRLNEMLSLFDNYDRYLKAVVISETSSGNARKRNEVIMASLAKQMEVTRASVEGLVVAFGDKGLLAVLKMVQVTLQGITGGLQAMDSVTGGLTSTIASTTLLAGGAVGTAGMVANSFGYYGTPARTSIPKVAAFTGADLAHITARGGAGLGSPLAASLVTGTASGTTESVLRSASGSSAADAAIRRSALSRASATAATMGGAGATGLVDSTGKLIAGSAAGSAAGEVIASTFKQKLSAIGQLAKGIGVLSLYVGAAVVALGALYKTWKYLTTSSEDLANEQRRSANKEKERQDAIREVAIGASGLSIDSGTGKISGRNMDRSDMDQAVSAALNDERLRSQITPLRMGNKIELSFGGATSGQGLAGRLNEGISRSETERIKNILLETRKFGMDDSAGFLQSRYAFRYTKSGGGYNNNALQPDADGGAGINVGGAKFASGYARATLQALIDRDIKGYQSNMQEYIEPQLRRIKENFGVLGGSPNFSFTDFVKDKGNSASLRKSQEIAGNLVSAQEGYVGLSSRKEARNIGNNLLTQTAFQNRGVGIFENADLTSKTAFTDEIEDFVKRDKGGNIIDFTKDLTVAFGKLRGEQGELPKSLTKISELSKIVAKDSILIKHGLAGQAEEILRVDKVEKDLIVTYNTSRGVMETLTEKDLPKLSSAFEKVGESIGSSLTTIDQLKSAIEALGHTIEAYKRISDTVNFGADAQVNDAQDRKRVLGFDSNTTYQDRVNANRDRDRLTNDYAMGDRNSSYGIGQYKDAYMGINDLMVSGRFNNPQKSRAVGVDVDALNLGGGIEKQARTLATLYDQVKNNGMDKSDPAIKKALTEAAQSAFGYNKLGEELKQKAYVQGDDRLAKGIENAVASGSKSIFVNMKLLSDLIGTGAGATEEDTEGGGKRYRESLISGSDGTLGASLGKAGLGAQYFSGLGLEDVYNAMSLQKPLEDAISIVSKQGRSTVRESSQLPSETMQAMDDVRKKALDQLTGMAKDIYDAFKKLREAAVAEMREAIEQAQILSEFGANTYDRSERAIAQQTGGKYEGRVTSPMMVLTEQINRSIGDSISQRRFSEQMSRDYILAAEAGIKFNSVLKQIAQSFSEGASQGLAYGGKYTTSNAGQQAQVQLGGYQKMLQASTEEIMKAEERVRAAGGTSKNAQLDKEFVDAKSKRSEIEKAMFADFVTGQNGKTGTLSLLAQEDQKNLARHRVEFPAAGPAVANLSNQLIKAISDYISTGNIQGLESASGRYFNQKSAMSKQIGGFQSQALGQGESMLQSLLDSRADGASSTIAERNKELGFQSYEQFKTNILNSGMISTTVIRAGSIINEAATSSQGDLASFAETVLKMVQQNPDLRGVGAAALKLDDAGLQRLMDIKASGTPYQSAGEVYARDRKGVLETDSTATAEEKRKLNETSSIVKELMGSVEGYRNTRDNLTKEDNRHGLAGWDWAKNFEIFGASPLSLAWDTQEDFQRKSKIQAEAKQHTLDLFGQAENQFKDDPTRLAYLQKYRKEFEQMPSDSPVRVGTANPADWEAENKHVENLQQISAKLLALLNVALAEKNPAEKQFTKNHTGALHSDEFPAILQKGEAVIPKAMVHKIPTEVLNKLPRFHAGLNPALGGVSAEAAANDAIRLGKILKLVDGGSTAGEKAAAMNQAQKILATYHTTLDEFKTVQAGIKATVGTAEYEAKVMALNKEYAERMAKVKEVGAARNADIKREAAERLAKFRETTSGATSKAATSEKVAAAAGKVSGLPSSGGSFLERLFAIDSAAAKSAEAARISEEARKASLLYRIGTGTNALGGKALQAGGSFLRGAGRVLGKVAAPVGLAIDAGLAGYETHNRMDEGFGVGTAGLLGLSKISLLPRSWLGTSDALIKAATPGGKSGHIRVLDRKDHAPGSVVEQAFANKQRMDEFGPMAIAGVGKIVNEANQFGGMKMEELQKLYNQGSNVALKNLGQARMALTPTASNPVEAIRFGLKSPAITTHPRGEFAGMSFFQEEQIKQQRKDDELKRIVANQRRGIGLLPSQTNYMPTMHNGGIASDEFPAILQRGEAVIPRHLVSRIPREVMSALPKFHGGADLSFLEARRTQTSFQSAGSDAFSGVREDMRRIADIVEKFFSTFRDQQSSTNTNDSLSTAVDMLAQIAARMEAQSTNSGLEQQLALLVESLNAQQNKDIASNNGQIVVPTGTPQTIEVHHKGLPEERTVKIVVDKFDEGALQQIVANLATDPNFVDMMMGAMMNKPMSGV